MAFDTYWCGFCGLVEDMKPLGSVRISYCLRMEEATFQDIRDILEAESTLTGDYFDGTTLLLSAVRKGRCDIVRMLCVEYGADLKRKCTLLGLDALQTAAYFGQEKILEFLMDHLGISTMSEQLKDLRECSYIRANSYFYGADTSGEDVKVLLAERCFRTLEGLVDLKESHIKSIFEDMQYLLEDLNGEMLIQILSFFIQETSLDYFFIIPLRESLPKADFDTAIKVLELLDNAPHTPSRNPRFLYQFASWILVHMIEADFEARMFFWGGGSKFLIGKLRPFIEDEESQLPILAATVKESSLGKNLLAMAHNQFLYCCMLPKTIRFLLEECGSDPNAKDEYGDSTMHVLLRPLSGYSRPTFRMMTDPTTFLCRDPNEQTPHVLRMLLDYGAHPCQRNAKGVQAFRLLEQRYPDLIPNQPRRLECIAASVVTIEANVDYKSKLPFNMHHFMTLH